MKLLKILIVAGAVLTLPANFEARASGNSPIPVAVGQIDIHPEISTASLQEVPVATLKTTPSPGLVLVIGLGLAATLMLLRRRRRY